MRRIKKIIIGKNYIVFFLWALFTTIPVKGKGQEFSISTNLLDYLNFGTINGEFSLSLTSKWSVYLQGRYNPFTFNKRGEVISNGYYNQMQNRQLSAAVGAKYWLWHTNSGWFISSQLSYTKYNIGGIFKSDTYEGSAYGVTVGIGYSLMLNKHINMDFGIGVMGGFTSYIKYLCPKCGKIVGEDKKIFVAPNNLLVQLSYLF